MNIQSNINNMLSLAGLLISQSPYVKEKTAAKIEGESLMGKGVSAEAGLKNIYNDVYKKLKSGEKKAYSETEISDIENRIGSLNKDIYSAIISKEDPRIGKYIDKDAFMQREERSNMLNELKGLRQINEARRAAQEAGIARITEKQASKNFINRINDDALKMSI